MTNGQPYTFTVRATTADGTSPPSAASNTVTPSTIPAAPSAVTATAGNAQATVSWTAPSSDGGAPITDYTVTSAPGGQQCTWTSGPLQCTVNGLTNGLSYTFTVVATNSAGDGPASTASNAVVPQAPGTYFHPLAPVRILDSRTAVGGFGGQLSSAQPKTLQLTGIAGVPADADAVVMNVTVTGGTANSFLTVYPAGATVPNASNLNFAVGQTIPNLTTVKIGTGGKVAFANNAGLVDVIADLVGFYSSATSDRYNPLPPNRILDSRTPVGGFGGKLVAGTPRTLQIVGVATIPATADAVVMNVTVTGGTQNSFVTTFPAGGSVPNASNVNFGIGETIPNLVTVKIGTGGKVAFANANGAVDVIADVVGYYDATTGDVFHSMPPARILDSRTAVGGFGGKVIAGTPKHLQVTGVAAIPGDADAVVGNVTVTNGTTNSFLTVFPTGGSVPNASNVNFAAGQTIPNLTAVKIGTGGKVAFANAIGATDVIFDAVGYFATT